MKAFYFVITANHTWGRGLNLKDALAAAKVKDIKKEKFVINCGICKADTPEESLKNIMQCYNVTDMGGISFYTEDPQNPVEFFNDRKMAKEFLLGWTTDESFIL